MGGVCFFCKRAPTDHECEVCKRNVCIQCSGSGNHNCYPRRWEKISAEFKVPNLFGEFEITG